MLKLTIEPGDKIFIGEGDTAVVLSFERHSGGGVELAFNAPRKVPIYTVFADLSKQFKNRKAKEQGNEINTANNGRSKKS